MLGVRTSDSGTHSPHGSDTIFDVSADFYLNDDCTIKSLTCVRNSWKKQARAKTMHTNTPSHGGVGTYMSRRRRHTETRIHSYTTRVRMRSIRVHHTELHTERTHAHAHKYIHTHK